MKNFGGANDAYTKLAVTRNVSTERILMSHTLCMKLL